MSQFRTRRWWPLRIRLPDIKRHLVPALEALVDKSFSLYAYLVTFSYAFLLEIVSFYLHSIEEV